MSSAFHILSLDRKLKQMSQELTDPGNSVDSDLDLSEGLVGLTRVETSLYSWLPNDYQVLEILTAKHSVVLEMTFQF